MADIRLAIAADFLFAEKLLEALSSENLSIERISAIELEPFGEERSLRLGAHAVEQIALDKVNWADFSHVFFAGKMAQAEILAQAVQAGCVILDLYGITALIETVPVVVPSVNNDAVAQWRAHNIVALANPQLSQLAIALKPLLEHPIQQVFVSSLVPSAYFGDEKVRQLAGQTAQLLNGIPLDSNQARVAFDVAPSSVQSDEKTAIFSKMAELQLAKILPNLTACTQFHMLQVPVFYGVSQMVSVQSEYSIDLDYIAQQWQEQSWVHFNETEVITPVKNGENESLNALEISQLLAKTEHQIQFWTVCDEQKFSLAFLSVELFKLLLDHQ